MTLSTRDRARPGIDHMEAIYRAIISGDAEAARQAVEHHITDTAAIAARLLSEEEPFNE